jgi:oligopeptide transport system ATP-binding protein
MSAWSPPILEVVDLVRHFPIRRSRAVVHAVNGVSFRLGRGETLALVGESGSGKTTVGRCVLRLIEPTSGQILFKGQDMIRLKRKELRNLRPRIQMVFQEPHESLNPRFTVEQILEDNLYVEGRLSRRERKLRVLEVMEMVKLPRHLLATYSHHLTGGEQQRVAIGRALSSRPDMIVLDEPTSALDISVRAEIIHLLKEVQRETSISYLFISHDLTAVKEISRRVVIMYLGEIVEIAPNPGIFTGQLHPYGKALLASVLMPDPRIPMGVRGLEGEIPSPVNLPSGCCLHPRCVHAVGRCRVDKPAMRAYGNMREAACHRAIELSNVEVGAASTTGGQRVAE